VRFWGVESRHPARWAVSIWGGCASFFRFGSGGLREGAPGRSRTAHGFRPIRCGSMLSHPPSVVRLLSRSEPCGDAAPPAPPGSEAFETATLKTSRITRDFDFVSVGRGWAQDHHRGSGMRMRAWPATMKCTERSSAYPDYPPTRLTLFIAGRGPKPASEVLDLRPRPPWQLLASVP